jgi:hypothetical protein
VFAAAEITTEQIMAEDKYEGVRVEVPALLGKMRGRIQIDVGFGDAITPQPRRLTFPTPPHRLLTAAAADLSARDCGG